MRISVALLATMLACGPSSSTVPTAATPGSPVAVASVAAPVRTGVFDLPGDGNGVVWDADHHTLFVTDGTANRVVAWSEAGTFTPVGAFAPPPAAAEGKSGLGSLVRLPGGSFVSPAFGFGVAGTINVLSADGTAPNTIASLDPARRRIAIAMSPDGAIYDTYFTAAGHTRTGGIAQVDLGHGETVVVEGLGKPVGIVATADTLFVADQDSKSIVAYARGPNAGEPRTIAASLPSCDQLTLLPNGDFVTGGKTGELTRIKRDGTFAVIASGLAEIRGNAYDASNKRLFFVEHVKGGHDRLHVVPLE